MKNKSLDRYFLPVNFCFLVFARKVFHVNILTPCLYPFIESLIKSCSAYFSLIYCGNFFNFVMGDVIETSSSFAYFMQAYIRLFSLPPILFHPSFLPPFIPFSTFFNVIESSLQFSPWFLITPCRCLAQR